MEGVPLVTRSIGEVVAVSGRDVRLEAEFCSDPLPLKERRIFDVLFCGFSFLILTKYYKKMLVFPGVKMHRKNII